MTGFAPDSPHIDKVGAGLFHMTGLTGLYPDLDSRFLLRSATRRSTSLNSQEHCTARERHRLQRRAAERFRTADMLALLEAQSRTGRLRRFARRLMYEPGLYAPKKTQKSRRALRATTAR
ncbi:MAG: hypothetical protein R2912_09230 [Eubacteriales bacterium]